MQDGAEAPVSGRRPGPGRMRWIVACLAALGGLLPAAAQGPPQEEAVTATTRYVDDNTCPATGAGTLANPYCRIQDAICASASGDTVSVAPGVYLEAVRMRPGVSLVSQGGPGVTTINAAGRPCTDSNFCTKRAGNQCSVVTFASGHTPSTVLDGFTLTGGAGLIQTVKVAGGGIFVFSSPTITNNVITGNILAGPRAEFTGAGIYSAVGQPIISGNVISGNQAVPPAGTSGNLTFAYGAGIAVGFNSSPTVTDNLIENNITGDEALAYSVGHGGGVSIWPGDSSQPGAVFDGNVIYGNVSDTTGGGLSLLTLPGTSAKVKVTNNVIDGNVSRTGGGVYIYQNTTDLINNTITGNDGNLGGGIYIAPSNSTLTVDISNDIIEGNTLRTFGNGGGIYTFDLTPGWDPLIRYNDFFGNDKNAIAGDRNDGNTIGVDGNFAADPLFVSKSTGDYHLQAGSPAVDKGLASVAPAVDFDNNPRGVDGDGTPNSPVAGDVDVGAFEFGAGCVPQPEVCDGVDNNCDDVVDEGFPDTDGDGMADCVDPCPADPANDADGDGVCGNVDNCPAVANPGQADADADGMGDACDACPSDPANDADGDGVCGNVDNCPAMSNPGQADADADGIGDACDACPADPANDADGDGVCGNVDNCPAVANTNQLDRDADGMGDACDPDADGDGLINGSDCAPLDPILNTAPVSPPLRMRFASPAGDALDWGGGLDTRVYSLYRWDFGGDFFVRTGETCYGTAIPGGTMGVPSAPASGFRGYLLTGSNACGEGTAGTDSAKVPRAVVGGCVDPLQDLDGDGYADVTDNCPLLANSLQADADGDGFGDACDNCAGPGSADVDGDGVCDEVDNCPAAPNPGQEDTDGDGIGDACEGCVGGTGVDTDLDGVCDPADNCPTTANTNQADADGDGLGDACDACPADPLNDADGDGFCADVDNCPTVFNPTQADSNGNGIGDACDGPCPPGSPSDPDADGVCDPDDNCPATPNPSQLDRDADGMGDACDTDADGDGVANGSDCSPMDPVFNAPPAAPTRLWFATVAGDRLEWTFRREARVQSLHTWSFDATGFSRLETCDGPAKPGTGADVPGVPAAAGQFTGYLAVPANACGDGPAGLATAGPRALAATCVDPAQDTDADGYADITDNCPLMANPSQADADGDGAGDACDACAGLGVTDADGDGVCDEVDNCPAAANPTQADSDGDGFGDACDACAGPGATDVDADGVCSAADNCPLTPNPAQTDSDADGIGDACDACPLDPSNDIDGDGVCGNVDNCPTVFNPNQLDTDGDGIGDACDPTPFG